MGSNYNLQTFENRVLPKLCGEHRYNNAIPMCVCEYLCSLNTAQILCWQVPVIQALHETAELACIFDAHTEQNMSLLTS